VERRGVNRFILEMTHWSELTNFFPPGRPCFSVFVFKQSFFDFILFEGEARSSGMLRSLCSSTLTAENPSRMGLLRTTQGDVGGGGDKPVVVPTQLY
jgi:hypothetical protein